MPRTKKTKKRTEIDVQPKQALFIRATAFEVLFGGSAGGGKSYGQLIDALQYAVKYAGSKQLILRRTYGELEKSLIRVSFELFPHGIYRYNIANHCMKLINGSVIDYGYCDSERDVYQYQSAEYDVIRFDELTHFTREMYVYLISRCRGANNFPKHIKSSTNPGGIGHTWVKERFVDIGPPGVEYEIDGSTRIFIPAGIRDNPKLLEVDPGYLRRLELLDGDDRKALLDGDWDLYDGQFFSEFDRTVHVCRGFLPPSHWRRYRTLDYGLDMLACYWVAVSDTGRAYVYRELYQDGLIASEAAARIKELTGAEKIYATYAGADLWNRHTDTGRSTAEIFYDHGVKLHRAQNAREQGWLDLKEWLHIHTDEQGEPAADLCICDSCLNLIRTLPALQYDRKNPNDIANEPHELTHAPDAIRYFVAGRPAPNRPKTPAPKYNFESERPKPKADGTGDKLRRI